MIKTQTRKYRETGGVRSVQLFFIQIYDLFITKHLFKLSTKDKGIKMLLKKKKKRKIALTSYIKYVVHEKK